MADMPDGGPPTPERSGSAAGSTIRRKGLEMHGGLPFIGFSTIVYGVVGLAVICGGAVTRFRGRK